MTISELLDNINQQFDYEATLTTSNVINVYKRHSSGQLVARFSINAKNYDYLSPKYLRTGKVPFWIKAFFETSFRDRKIVECYNYRKALTIQTPERRSNHKISTPEDKLKSLGKDDSNNSSLIDLKLTKEQVVDLYVELSLRMIKDNVLSVKQKEVLNLIYKQAKKQKVNLIHWKKYKGVA